MELLMNITEIRRKYPNVKFYKVKKTPIQSMFVMERLEDFFDLCQNVAYTEIYIDNDTARESILKSLVGIYFENVDPDVSIYKKFDIEFSNYLNENMSGYLNELLENKEHTLITLYGINMDIMYEVDEDFNISEAEFSMGLKEIDKIYQQYAREKKKIEEEMELERVEKEARIRNRDNDIREYILSYKEKYRQLKTKVEKEDLIKMLQLELKNKFNVDGRNDYRVSKIAIKKIYEEE